MAFILRKNNFLILFILTTFFSCKNETSNITDGNTIINTDTLQKKVATLNYISYSKSFGLSTSNHIPKKIKGENLNFETIIEPTNKPVDLSWKIIEMSIPSAWEYAFCDNTGCYLEMPKEKKLNTISKESEKDIKQIKLQVNTNGLSGEAKLILELKNKNSSDTLFFEANY